MSSQTAETEREGFFYCEHCNHVVELQQQEFAEVNEQHKCPRCHKWAVVWRFAMRNPRRELGSVPVERGPELFAAMRAAVG